jgi:hypothetical protein
MRTAALLEQVMLFELTPFVVAVRSPFDSGNARTSNTSVDIYLRRRDEEGVFTDNDVKTGIYSMRASP